MCILVMCCSCNVYLYRTDEYRFIDFEYFGYNFRGFDIGNHFCEFTSYDIRRELYPTADTQRSFVREYLTAFFGTEPTSSQVDDVVAEANLFASMSNLLWGIWGIIQAKHSNISTFDFFTYADKRLTWYHDQRAQFGFNQ